MVNDDAAIGDVIDGMYAMISGPAGPRDWDRQAELFHPDARQMRTGVDDDGKAWIVIMGLEQYRRDTQPFFDTGPFFEVELARSRRVLAVPRDRSILQTLQQAGVSVLYSCTEGTCGTCETDVLSGEPDHRDCVLTDEERAGGETMMICVSRCRAPGGRLVLDL